VDLGEKVDRWFELYGRAVEDNTLQERIEAHQKQQQEQQLLYRQQQQQLHEQHRQQEQQQSWFRNQQEGKKKFSYVQQLLQEEEQERRSGTGSRSRTAPRPEMAPALPAACSELPALGSPIPLDALKDIVRNVLLTQGISNPSDSVLEDAIQNYLQSQNQQVARRAMTCKFERQLFVLKDGKIEKFIL
jgi:hypothetical protein